MIKLTEILASIYIDKMEKLSITDEEKFFIVVMELYLIMFKF